jgi:16S rRNA (cytosine1402-N4)-methyltransferase
MTRERKSRRPGHSPCDGPGESCPPQRPTEAGSPGAAADATPNPAPPAGSRRRPRYAGTHPRRFEHRYKELNRDAFPQMQQHIRGQGRTPAGSHVPVLVDEVMAALQPSPGEVVLDCTLGYGGHAEEFMRRVGPTGRLIGLDLDGAELRRTGERLASIGVPVTLHGTAISTAESWTASLAPVSLHRSHFAGMGKVMAAEGLTGFDVVLADLGVSSMQIDDPSRGFSYKHDGPLDMRMDDRERRSAGDILATIDHHDLAAALWDLADEPDHERIADVIVAKRRSRPIRRTSELVSLVLEAKGLTRGQWREIAEHEPAALHPAARTFQALRMLVNDEANGLTQFLRVVPYSLSPSGRVGVITFHSGEERRVVEAFAKGVAEGAYEAVSEQPHRPSPRELRANPRSRSARLHWARRCAS